MTNAINLTGIFNRTITNEVIDENWKDQIDRLTDKNGFTVESAKRICAIAEHFNCIRLSEKTEYIGEILKLGLPYGLACDMVALLEEYYK